MPNRIRNIFNIINNVEERNSSIYVLFKSKNNNHPERWEVRKMRSSENLIRDLLELNRDFLSKFINNENLVVVDYQPGPSLGQNFVEQIPINEVHEFEGIKNLVEECTLFFRDGLEIHNFRPYAYVIKCDVNFENQDEDSSIFVFQHIQKQKAFRKGKILSKNHDKYDSLGEELYFLSDKFDCLYCDFNEYEEDDYNNMFIFNKQHFDWIFGFEEIFQNEIRERFQNDNGEFEDIINYENFAELVINNYQFIRKTYKLLQNGNFNTYFNRNVLERVPREANILELEWGQDGRLIVNETNVKKILNIVNEDYLKSIVSDTVFLSLSKTNI